MNISTPDSAATPKAVLPPQARAPRTLFVAHNMILSEAEKQAVVRETSKPVEPVKTNSGEVGR